MYIMLAYGDPPLILRVNLPLRCCNKSVSLCNGFLPNPFLIFWNTLSPPPSLSPLPLTCTYISKNLFEELRRNESKSLEP